MNIDLVAKLKTYNDFIETYMDGDEKKLYKGKSLLFFSISNNDLESRYLITKFLLDKGIDVNVLNESNENPLHILLSRVNHNLEQTTELCKILIEKGVNVNQLDKHNRVPIQYLINMKNTDEELEGLCKLFEFERLLVDKKNAWGLSPLDLAQKLPFRKQMLSFLKEHSTND